MPYLESTIKTQIVMSQSSRMHHLKNYGDKFLLHGNYGVADLPKPLPKFYRECLEAWRGYGH